MALLEVRDLDGHLRRRRRRRSRRCKGASFDARARRDLGAGRRESGSGKSVTALSILQLLPYPARAATRAAASASTARSWSARRATRAAPDPRQPRSSMIFQEPMTSLNPLHTIERQISEVLILHKRLARARRARRARSSCCDLVGIPDAESAARRLSAPALGRPAPAGHDRHGARQRARPPDRRRADDRARRHHPGADPEAPQGAAGRASAWRCCSSPTTSASCARWPTGSAS